LNLTTIAEGVETRAQLKKLIDLRCDMVQGYLFSKPISVDDFTQLLHDN
jgi:EAL domain-containing protein (putative c-di-GMP-specific phosphodiesterase class I)